MFFVASRLVQSPKCRTGEFGCADRRCWLSRLVVVRCALGGGLSRFIQSVPHSSVTTIAVRVSSIGGIVGEGRRDRWKGRVWPKAVSDHHHATTRSPPSCPRSCSVFWFRSFWAHFVGYGLIARYFLFRSKSKGHFLLRSKSYKFQWPCFMFLMVLCAV